MYCWLTAWSLLTNGWLPRHSQTCFLFLSICGFLVLFLCVSLPWSTGALLCPCTACFLGSIFSFCSSTLQEGIFFQLSQCASFPLSLLRSCTRVILPHPLRDLFALVCSQHPRCFLNSLLNALTSLLLDPVLL